MQTFIKEIQKFKGGTVEDRIAHFYCSSIEWHLTWQLVAHQWCYYLVVDWEQDWILLDWTWNGKLKLSCWDRKRTMTRELEGIHSQRQIECAKFLKKEKPGYLATLSRHWILSCFKFNWQIERAIGRLVQGYQNQIKKQTDALPDTSSEGNDDNDVFISPETIPVSVPPVTVPSRDLGTEHSSPTEITQCYPLQTRNPPTRYSDSYPWIYKREGRCSN